MGRILSYQSRFMPNRSFLLIFTCLAGAGCSPLTTVQADGSIAYHHFGYVKVVIPSSYSSGSEKVSATDITTTGIKIGDGLSVGYMRDKKIIVPLDCKAVILVSNQQQLDQTVQLLKQFGEKEGLCASLYTP
jgi:hypothetical protein